MHYKDAPELTQTWLACPRPHAEPGARLLCFHHAGGSPSSFRSWLPLLPDHAELLAARLPGREARLRETPLTQVAEIVEPLAEALAPLITDTRLVIFGHSLGAMLAFELAHELRRRELLRPRALIVSGRNAPGFGRTLELHQLGDRELIDEVQRIYGGIPQAVLDEPELLALTLPVLRADLTLNETYAPPPEREPLDCHLLAFAGLDDPRVGKVGLEAWAEHTRGEFEVEQCEGDHFYLATPEGQRWLLGRIEAALGR